MVWKFGSVGKIHKNLSIEERNSNKVRMNKLEAHSRTFSSMTGANLAEDMSQLFEEWVLAIKKNDMSNAQPISDRINVLLVNNRKGNEAVYQRIARILSDPLESRDIKLSLINMLGRVATPDVVQLFLDVLNSNLPPDIRQHLIRTISQIGDYYWDKQYFPETAAMLLNSWRQTQDAEALQSLASAILRVGDINSINQLLAAIPSSTVNIADIPMDQNPKAAAVLNALNSMSKANPDIVPDIARFLNDSKAKDIEIAVYIKILGTIQTTDAARCLIQFAENANEQWALPLKSAINGIYNADCLNYISSIMKNAGFKSDAVRSAILSVINRT
jgi:hypothetical protein